MHLVILFPYELECCCDGVLFFKGKSWFGASCKVNKQVNEEP